MVAVACTAKRSQFGRLPDSARNRIARRWARSPSRRPIDAPRERVFDFLCDLANRPAFTDHFISQYRLERLESRGVGAAARLRVARRHVWMETVIVEVSPPATGSSSRARRAGSTGFRSPPDGSLSSGPAVSGCEVTLASGPSRPSAGQASREAGRRALSTGASGRSRSAEAQGADRVGPRARPGRGGAGGDPAVPPDADIDFRRHAARRRPPHHASGRRSGARRRAAGRGGAVRLRHRSGVRPSSVDEGQPDEARRPALQRRRSAGS